MDKEHVVAETQPDPYYGEHGLLVEEENPAEAGCCCLLTLLLSAFFCAALAVGAYTILGWLF